MPPPSHAPDNQILRAASGSGSGGSGNGFAAGLATQVGAAAATMGDGGGGDETGAPSPPSITLNTAEEGGTSTPPQTPSTKKLGRAVHDDAAMDALGSGLGVVEKEEGANGEGDGAGGEGGRGSAGNKKLAMQVSFKGSRKRPITEAARNLGVSVKVLTQVCQEHIVQRSPYKKVKKIDDMLRIMCDKMDADMAKDVRDRMDRVWEARDCILSNPNSTAQAVATLRAHGGAPTGVAPDLTAALSTCTDRMAPVYVKDAIFDKASLAALAPALEDALKIVPEVFTKTKFVNDHTRYLTRHVAVVGGSEDTLTEAEVRTLCTHIPTLAPLVAALVGRYELTRMQLNLYAPEEDPHAGHAPHHDGLQDDELTLILNVGASITQDWQCADGRTEQVNLRDGDVVCFGRSTDQRWQHGIKYGAARGKFRASIALTLKIPSD